jgi:hypothetical protein
VAVCNWFAGLDIDCDCDNMLVEGTMVVALLEKIITWNVMGRFEN